MWRAVPLASVVGCALLAAGCGSPAPSGSAAAKVVKGDWEFNHRFTGAQRALDEYDRVERVTCAARPDAQRDVHCTLEVSKRGRDQRSVKVVVHYDAHGVVASWDFDTGSGA
jgi:hypothetical protein